MKNHYVVLGVPRSETMSGIRTAYRDLAKRFHPDLAGDTSTSSFQEIAEAYEVLSDPERRQAHDRELDQVRQPRLPSSASIPVHVADRKPAVHWQTAPIIEPLTARPSTVEPLIPSERTRRDRFQVLWWIVR